MEIKAKQRLKPRRVYVSESEWRACKAHVAREGTSVSKWIRDKIKEIAPFLILIFTSYVLYKSVRNENLVQNIANFIVNQ